MNHWLDEAKKRLEAEASNGNDVRFERLRAQGMITERGEVTGRLHRWNACLAITGRKPDSTGTKILFFRCLKPVFGMPGGATIDIQRDSMVDYLSQGKRVIVAERDERLEMWREGAEVHLSPIGYIRTDLKAEAADQVDVPEFTHVESGL
jgi:hypothetical protein